IRLIDACMDGNGLTVFIGSEHQDPDLQLFSVVTSTYTEGKRTGAVGIIRPTRMRNSRAINVVDSLSRAINRGFDNSCALRPYRASGRPRTETSRLGPRAARSRTGATARRT